MRISLTFTRMSFARGRKFFARSAAAVFAGLLAASGVFSQTASVIGSEKAEGRANVVAAVKEAAPAGPAAPAQAAPPAPKQRKVGALNVSGSLRLRAESYGWFDTPNYEDSYTLGAAVLRLSVGQQKERYDWLIEGEFPVLLNIPGSAVAPAPQGQLGPGASYFAASGRQDASAILKQAFVRVKGVFGDKASTLRVGRFEFADGAETTPSDATLATLKREHLAHRLIGNFGWSHVGRSFDAVQYVRASKAGNFTFVGGRPTEGVFQLRGNRELDVDFWYGAYTRPLAGKNFNSELRLLALHYHDGRGALKTDNRPVAARRADSENIRLNTAGGSYVAAIKTGRGTIDLLAWGVGQSGSWGRLEHRAGAVALEGGFQPAGERAEKLKPWVRVGYARGTGDGDASDGSHNTFFQVMPTPRIYARFPFYNMMNTEDVYVQLKLKPHSRVALRADVHGLRLSSGRDLWYAGGGAFQEETFGYTGRAGGGRRGLGTLFDVSADITVTRTTTVTLYGAGVRGGGVQSAIYPAGGLNPTARMFYAELTKRF